MTKFLPVLTAFLVAAAAHRQLPFRFQRPTGIVEIDKGLQKFLGDMENVLMKKFDDTRTDRMHLTEEDYGFLSTKASYDFSLESGIDKFTGLLSNRISKSGEEASLSQSKFPSDNHEPHHPKFPPLFANLTIEDLKQLFDILRNGSLTKEERDNKLSEWAKARGSEFAVSCSVQNLFLKLKK